MNFVDSLRGSSGSSKRGKGNLKRSRSSNNKTTASSTQQNKNTKQDKALRKQVLLHNTNVRKRAKTTKNVKGKASSSSSSSSSSITSSTSTFSSSKSKSKSTASNTNQQQASSSNTNQTQSKNPFDIVSPANTFHNLRQSSFSTAFSTGMHDHWFQIDHPELSMTMEEATNSDFNKKQKVKLKQGRRNITKGTKNSSSSSSQQNEQQSLEEKMKAHNKKFQKKKQQYEPRKHSAREVRNWETKTNRKWNQLDVDERVEVNAEITKMIKERK